MSFELHKPFLIEKFEEESIPVRVHSATTGQQLLTSQIDSSSDGIVAGPSQPVDIAASQPANTNIEESHLANSDEINKTTKFFVESIKDVSGRPSVLLGPQTKEG
jgi:hypothetical protein